MKILVVSPHPDDETLGAGGTILKRKKRGDEIYWVVITEASELNGWDKEFVFNRKKQIKSINKFYGFEEFFDLKYTPGSLSHIDEGEMISVLSDIFSKVKPEWIIIPGEYDAHSDHRVTYNCCMAAAKTFRAPFIKRITTMEILSETDQGFKNEKFCPNMFVNISEEIEGKLEAAQIYDSEIMDSPFPRSIRNIKALAELRGAASNCMFAEGFKIIRFLE